MEAPPSSVTNASVSNHIATVDSAGGAAAVESSEPSGKQAKQRKLKKHRKKQSHKKRKHKKHKKHKKKKRKHPSSSSSSSSSDSDRSAGQPVAVTGSQPVKSQYNVSHRPNLAAWGGGSAVAAPSKAVAAAMVGLTPEEHSRERAKRQRRFVQEQELQSMTSQERSNGAGISKPTRMAHAGGKITTNKESALYGFVVRLLREGKALTPAQRKAALEVGVDVPRLESINSIYREKWGLDQAQHI